MPTLEHQFCDICGNDMGYHQVEKIKDSKTTRICHAHMDEEVELYFARLKFNSSADRAIANLTESRERLKSALGSASSRPFDTKVIEKDLSQF